MGVPSTPWFAVRRELAPRQRAVLALLAVILPLAVWSAVSYVPWIWHPMMAVERGAQDSYLKPGTLVEHGSFVRENQRLVSAGQMPATGVPANPVFLPAPHLVAVALYQAFVTPPRLRGDPWLHQSLWQSIQVIFWGFTLSALVGVPLGVLCGTFAAIARVVEPFVDFIRYMPAPAFGALMVAILGINDAPKIAVIFIGTFFQMVLVVANTTRQLDRALLEAAQTLGARNRQLVTSVILPGIMPNLYSDMRVLLGWAWTYLIVAELIGATSGISYFINRQGKLLNFANVYAGIAIIGMIGLVTDQILSALGRALFPWQNQPVGAVTRWALAIIGFLPRLVLRTVARNRAEYQRSQAELLARHRAAAAPSTPQVPRTESPP